VEEMTDYVVPVLLILCCCLALRKKENSYELMLSGATDGLKLLLTLTPTLILLLTAIYMLRASGAMEQLSRLLTPILKWTGIPPETAMLVLIRPISGSAALAVGAELMTAYGPDSLIGKTTAVMLGSTETTFYAMSIYLAHCGVRRSRYILPAALAADFTGFFMAAATARYL
jgi:spore maturation protein B